MLDDKPEKRSIDIVRWEIPLSKIIPKKIYDAQISEEALLPERDLLALAQPDSLDWRLRIRYNALLQKYNDPRTIPDQDGAITQEQIFAGICSYDVFRKRIDIPAKAVFISKRVGSFLEDQDALLTASSTRLWEIISAPVTNKDGTINIEAAKILHKSITLLLDRKFGQAIQRVASTNVPPPAQMDPQVIEAQIRQLEQLDGSK